MKNQQNTPQELIHRWYKVFDSDCPLKLFEFSRTICSMGIQITHYYNTLLENSKATGFDFRESQDIEFVQKQILEITGLLLVLRDKVQFNDRQLQNIAHIVRNLEDCYDSWRKVCIEWSSSLNSVRVEVPERYGSLKKFRGQLRLQDLTKLHPIRLS